MDGVEVYEYGYAPLGLDYLLYTVHFFRIGDTLVDTGSFKSRRALPDFSERPPAQVLLTHYHEDHSGNARYFQQKYGTEIYGHPLTAPLLETGFPIQVYERIMFGPVEPLQIQLFPGKIHIGNWEAEWLHVPGHSDDHCCFYVPERGWLFSGDMYVADRIKIWRRTENLKLQREGLRKLLALDFDTLFCAHNPQEKGGRERLRAKLDFFDNFYGEVALHARRGTPVKESMRLLGRKESYFTRFMTEGDVSVENMFRDVYREEGFML